MSNDAIELLKDIRDGILGLSKQVSELSEYLRNRCTNTPVQVSEHPQTPAVQVSDKEGGEGGGGSLKRRPGRKNKFSYSVAFERFWTAYPRREGKGRAWKYWTRDSLDSLIETIVLKVSEYKLTEQWRKDSGKFIPHPGTWLNDRRWEDDPNKAGDNGRALRVISAPGNPCHGHREGETWTEDDGTQHRITNGWWYRQRPDRETEKLEKVC